MTDADRSKLECLCCLSVVQLADCFARRSRNIGVESDAKLEAHVRRWLKTTPNLESVERVVNHLHVYDEFSGLTEDEYDAAAVTLFIRWNEAVKRIDPGLRVEKVEDYGPTVTFYKQRLT